MIPLPHPGNGSGAPRGNNCEDSADELQGLVHRMLELLGEDPERSGLRDTPSRV